MNIDKLMHELNETQRACSNITDDECKSRSCPFHGEKSICMFEDFGLGMPCDWEIPQEIL